MKKNIGNILIFLSVLLFVYIYLPFFLAYLPQNTLQVQAGSGSEIISIAKINAQAPIITNVDPWEEADYTPALQKGVAQAKGFASPGDGKLVYLFAHSSLPPWQMTRVNTAFLRLGELQNGDQIVITGPCHSVTANSEGVKQSQELNSVVASSSATAQSDVCTYKYEVFDKKEFWPTQIEIFNQDKDKDELILQTCTPVGTDLKRLLVFAKPIT